MYKTDYTEDDYIRVTDECAEQIRKVLQDHFAKLEEMREAINDHYPYEDLLLAMQKVDDGEEYTRSLLKYLDECTIKKKEAIIKKCKELREMRRKKSNEKRHKTIVWKPDESLPYVIHSEDSLFFNGMVIIKPVVLRYGTFPHSQIKFEYLTNREHGFVGQLLQHDANKAYFKLAENQFEGSSVLRIAAMTNDEFKLEQAKHTNLAIKSKEELVRLFIDNLND